MKNFLAIYIHWPFCKVKCPYCDFNSHVINQIEQEKWLESYLREIDYFALKLPGRAISSIFFGGGTPSLMEPFIVEGIINHIAEKWQFTGDTEVTLETNPTSAEAEKFRNFKKAGINRISMGIQALNDKDLKFLGREHNATEALQALDMAKGIFDRYSFDLIYARPEQTLQQWRYELDRALKLAGGHLSLYQLTIEKGTPFYSLYKSGAFVLPNEDIAAEMYQITDEILESVGMTSYEISNYARKGQESRHNLTYWNYGEYIGIGPGAHGRMKNGNSHGRIATMMIHDPKNWLESVKNNGHGLQSSEKIKGRELIEEVIMMGLRLRYGIKRENFKEITGYDFEEVLSISNLEKFISGSLIELDNDYLKVTKKGRLVLNNVIAELL